MTPRPPERDFVPPAERWEDNGCVHCRAKWTNLGAVEPRLLGEVDALMGSVYRCGVCGAYWLTGFSNPHEIAAAEARSAMPDYEQRERDQGLR